MRQDKGGGTGWWLRLAWQTQHRGLGQHRAGSSRPGARPRRAASQPQHGACSQKAPPASLQLCRGVSLGEPRGSGEPGRGVRLLQRRRLVPRVQCNALPESPASAEPVPTRDGPPQEHAPRPQTFCPGSTAHEHAISKSGFSVRVLGSRGRGSGATERR